MWNNQAHMEAYLAVPSMGAVLHTLNVRLFPDQLAYIINHAEDKVIIIDSILVPIIAELSARLPNVQAFIVDGSCDSDPLSGALGYEQLLADQEPGFSWPELDERAAA